MVHFEIEKTEYLISCDPEKLNVGLIHDFLRNSYWAKNIPREIVERSIAHSLNFGLYRNGQQLGFARVISDYTTFAYLADVFILESERGKGLSKLLMEIILEHPQLQGLRNFSLMTRDAQGLYEKFGFRNLDEPQRFMCKKKEHCYE